MQQPRRDHALMSRAGKNDRALSPLNHFGRGFTRAEECAQSCDSPRSFELIRRGFHQAFAERTTCVRDENLNRAKLTTRLVKTYADLLRIRDVCRDGQGM